MCLGIPGKIKEIYKINNIIMGKVNYSGVEVEVCLEATPAVKVDEYVIVHAGFTLLQEIDEINQNEQE